MFPSRRGTKIILSQPSLFLQDMANEAHAIDVPCIDCSTTSDTLKLYDMVDRKTKKKAVATKKKIVASPTLEM
jgi:hypothetical protein